MVEFILLLILVSFVGVAICIEELVSQYKVLPLWNTCGKKEGKSMMYHRCAAQGRNPLDYSWKWQADMYWQIRGTERVFNYTSELFKRFAASIKEVVDSLKRWFTDHWRKLTAVSIGIAVLTLFYDSNYEMLFGAAGLVGTPNSKVPKVKEKPMNKVSSKVHSLYNKVKHGLVDAKSTIKLMNAIFNTGWVPFNPTGKDTGKDKGIPVFTLDFKSRPPKVSHVKTAVPGSIEEKNLVLDKKCVLFGAGLKLKTLRYFHVSIPRDRLRATHAMYNLIAFIRSNDLVPFGSLKKDSKNRVKFYVLERWEAERYSRHTGDFLPYFHKILTDCKHVFLLNVLVVNPANYTGKGEPNELAHLNVDDKNDGCGFIRPSMSSSQFQAAPDGFGHDEDEVNDKFSEPAHDKMPIAKGYLDNKLVETDEEWDKAIGEEYDMVIFRKDQIKCFDNLAESGPWVVGFTWMDGRTIPYPFHWELTQFLELKDPVEKVLRDAGCKAVDNLIDQCSSREGLIEYVSAKVYNEIKAGYDTIIKMKVLAVLMSDITHNFAWVKHQIKLMMLGDTWKIIKSYGIFGDGVPLLTNDVKAETDPAYVPYEVAEGVGGDNDGDYIVSIVNKKLGIIMYWRFPVVGGPFLRAIPESLMPALEDKHPEIVELFVEYMLPVSEEGAFNRNKVKKTRNTRPLNKAYMTAWAIMDGEDIGVCTNILKRLRSVQGEWHILLETTRKKAIELGECADAAVERLEKWKKDYLLPNIAKAEIGVESGAIAIKYDVEGFEKPIVETWITKTYPMFYAKLNKPTSWEKLAETAELCNTESTVNPREFDTRLYGDIMSYALERFNSWESDTVPVKRMAEAIDILGIDVSLTNLDQAMKFLGEIGTAFRAVFEKWGNPKEGSKEHKLRGAELSLVVKHAERCGAKLKLDVLKLACHEYLMHTKGTGACAIHMCGDRIFDVFGKHVDTPNNVKVELPRPKKKGVVFKAYLQGTEIPFDKINKVISTGKVVGDTVKFSRIPALKIEKGHLDRIPTPYETKDTKVSYDIDVVNVVSFRTKKGKATNRAANITVQVVKVVTAK